MALIPNTQKQNEMTHSTLIDDKEILFKAIDLAQSYVNHIAKYPLQRSDRIVFDIQNPECQKEFKQYVFVYHRLIVELRNKL